MILSALKSMSPSPGTATDAGVMTRTSLTSIAPHIVAVPGLVAPYFAPWTVACGRVSVTNSPDFSAATARTPGMFALDTVLRIADMREVCPMAPTPLVRRRVRIWDNFILRFSWI